MLSEYLTVNATTIPPAACSSSTYMQGGEAGFVRCTDFGLTAWGERQASGFACQVSGF